MRAKTRFVLPGWSVGPDHRCAIAHLWFVLRTPRNDSLLPIHNPALVAVELHAAERAALVEIADGIGRHLGLLGHRMLAVIFAAAGRAIAEIVGAMIVPPGALVVGGAVEN